MTDLPLVEVSLRFHEQGLKVVWRRNGLEYEPYLIDPGRLQRFGDAARAKLGPLVERARSRTLNDAAPDLRAIAKAGNDLFKALFITAAGGESAANEVRDSLAEMADTEFRILVTVDRALYVPWGLIYDGDPTKLADDSSIETFRDFWCIKRRLSAIHYRVPPRQTKAQEEFSYLCVLNRVAFETASKTLDDAERRLVTSIIDGGAQAYTVEEFEAAWKQRHGLVYFYCHANGSSLELTKSDQVTVDSVALLTNGKKQGSCLFFLNGCATAFGGNEKGGFLEATTLLGLRGFVGTEAKIPDVFALRFGTAFMHDLLNSARALHEVMATMRERHWPLSLIYSLYGDPEFKVVRSFASPDSSPKVRVNYSTVDVGEGLI